MSRSKIIPLIAVLLAVGLIVGLFLSAEYEEREVDVGFRGEARINPFLAAERLAGELGLPGESMPFLSEVPPDDFVVVLSSTGAGLQGEMSLQLLDWVERGGHLILGISAPDWTKGLGDEETDEDEQENYDPISTEWFENPLFDALDLKVTWFDQGRVVHDVRLSTELHEVAFEQRYSLDDSAGVADLAVEEREAADLLQYRRGRGMITILSSVDCFTNAEIGEYDHARFLWELANTPSRAAGLWLVYGDERGFFSLLFSRAWMVILSLAVWLFFWLWRSSGRFGPIIEREPLVRRDFAEHVSATGAFLWKRRRSPELLGAVRRRLMRDLERRRPDLHDKETEALAEHFAEQTSLAPERCLTALRSTVITDAQKFTRAVSDLETMRNSL